MAGHASGSSAAPRPDAAETVARAKTAMTSLRGNLMENRITDAMIMRQFFIANSRKIVELAAGDAETAPV